MEQVQVREGGGVEAEEEERDDQKKGKKNLRKEKPHNLRVCRMSEWMEVLTLLWLSRSSEGRNTHAFVPLGS